MNILPRIPSPFSVDGAYVWFQAASLLFLAATILTGAGTIITGFIANRRTAIALAEQQERAARAEKGLTEVEKRTTFPTISDERRANIVARLKALPIDNAQGQPTGVVAVVYLAHNRESERFARELIGMFRDAGWPVWGQLGLQAQFFAFSGLAFTFETSEDAKIAAGVSRIIREETGVPSMSGGLPPKSAVPHRITIFVALP